MCPERGTVVDREARSKLAEALSEYLDCCIDSLEFDELTSIYTKDSVAWNLCGEAWYIYGDAYIHRNEGRFRIPREVEQTMRRWTELLASDVECGDPNYEWSPSFLEGPGTTLDLFKPWSRHNLLYVVVQVFLAFVVGLFRRQEFDFVKNEFYPFASERDWVKLRKQKTQLKSGSA